MQEDNTKEDNDFNTIENSANDKNNLENNSKKENLKKIEGFLEKATNFLVSNFKYIAIGLVILCIFYFFIYIYNSSENKTENNKEIISNNNDITAIKDNEGTSDIIDDAFDNRTIATSETIELEDLKVKHLSEIESLKQVAEAREKKLMDIIETLLKENKTLLYELESFQELKNINKKATKKNKINKNSFKINSIYMHSVWLEYKNKTYSLQKGDFIPSTKIQIIDIEPEENRIKTNIGYIQ